MEWTEVTTQAELDAAIKARKQCIELAAAITVEIDMPCGFIPLLKSIAGARIRLLGGRVEACGSGHVEAWRSSHVEARGSSHVEARGSSCVVARGSSHVVAWESSHVEACESSHVEAWGSSHVEAWGSSHVVARGAASASLFGVKVEAVATVSVAVHLHDGAKCSGGTQIVIQRPQTPEQWCEFYGAEIVGGDAVLFKGVDGDWKSPRGVTYKPGTETSAPDWDGGDLECGCGLHFSPSAGMALEFYADAKRFVACRVPLASIAIHPTDSFPNKVKAERCWNWYECDRRGLQIGERFENKEAGT